MRPEDITRAVAPAHETLATTTGCDWHVTAGELEWTCWETVEHMSDDLFTYAAQLAPAAPSLSTHVPFGWHRRRAGGPATTIFVDPAEGPSGLLQVFESCGAMLAAMVHVVPPGKRSFHAYGPSDASGFAAMGVVEVLVHMQDVAAGLGLPWVTTRRSVHGGTAAALPVRADRRPVAGPPVGHRSRGSTGPAAGDLLDVGGCSAVHERRTRGVTTAEGTSPW